METLIYILQHKLFAIFVAFLLTFYLCYLVYEDYKISKKLCLIITVPIEYTKINYYNSLKKYLKSISDYKNNKLKVVCLIYKEEDKHLLGKYINSAILLNTNSDYYAIQDFNLISETIPDLLYTDYPIFTFQEVRKCEDCIKTKNSILIINKEDLIETNGLPNENKSEDNILNNYKNLLQKTNNYFYHCNTHSCSVEISPLSIQNFEKIYHTLVSKIYDIKKDISDDLINLNTNMKNGYDSFIHKKKFRYTTKYDNGLIENKIINNDYMHNDGLDQVNFDKLKIKSENIKKGNVDFTQLYIVERS
jgi:hypothetical protein